MKGENMSKTLDLATIRANRMRQLDAVAGLVVAVESWGAGPCPAMTCTEVDAVAEVARAYGQDASADALLYSHAWNDDEDDAHLAVDLRIENTYADGHTSTSEVTACVPMPDPYPEEDSDDMADWADAHLFPFTGDGHGGDAVYEVTIVRASVAEFAGRRFEFGL